MTEAQLELILFLDIETVPQQPALTNLSESWQILWEKKAKQLMRFREEENAEDIFPRAGIYAEFGKIICISMGFFYRTENGIRMRLKSFFGKDETQILTDFHALLNEYFGERYRFLCAHNGKEFDFPYLCRRSLINGLPLPKGLRIMGNKPWENKHLLDTMQLWSFGDYKSFTSLELLSSCFNIPSPKDEITGAEVYKTFYEDDQLDRIVAYCEKDVCTLANVYRAMNGMETLPPEQFEGSVN